MGEMVSIDQFLYRLFLFLCHGDLRMWIVQSNSDCLWVFCCFCINAVKQCCWLWIDSWQPKIQLSECVKSGSRHSFFSHFSLCVNIPELFVLLCNHMWASCASASHIDCLVMMLRWLLLPGCIDRSIAIRFIYSLHMVAVESGIKWIAKQFGNQIFLLSES